MGSLAGKIATSIKYRILNLWLKLAMPVGQFFKFYLANFSAFSQKRILIKARPPRCNQKVLVTGIGKVSFDDGCVFGYKLGGHFHYGLVEIQPRYADSLIEIGKNVTTNNNLLICCANHVSIGDNTLIGGQVTILDHEAHKIDPGKRNEIGPIGKVEIGKNVWIGNNVMILKNTIIGENSIIAAGAIVSGTFPANVIIGGIPAKIIKELDDTNTVIDVRE